jgi:hypothetical protein
MLSPAVPGLFHTLRGKDGLKKPGHSRAKHYYSGTGDADLLGGKGITQPPGKLR